MAKVGPPSPVGPSGTPVSIPRLKPIAPIPADKTISVVGQQAAQGRLVNTLGEQKKKKKADETFQWSDLVQPLRHPSRIYTPTLRLVEGAVPGAAKLGWDLSRQIIPEIPFYNGPQPHSESFAKETIAEGKKLFSGELIGDIGRSIKRGDFPIAETVRVAGDVAILTAPAAKALSAGAIGLDAAAAGSAEAGSLGAEAAAQTITKGAKLRATVAENVAKGEHVLNKVATAPFTMPIKAFDLTFEGLGKAQRWRANSLYAKADALAAENPLSPEIKTFRDQAMKIEARYGKDITVGGVATTVTNKVLNQFSNRVLRRAIANENRINTAMLDINDRPEFFDQVNPETGKAWGPLTSAENEAVIAILNGRARLVRAIAERVGMMPQDIAYLGRYNGVAKYHLSPEGAALAVDFLNNNLSTEQYARLATASQKLSDVLELQSEQARVGYGRRKPLSPTYDVPTPMPDRLASALAQNGRPDLAAQITELMGQGFFDDIQSPDVQTFLQTIVEQAPESVALDKNIYPAKERNNIAFYQRVREAFNAQGGFTVRGTGPDIAGGPTTPMTEGARAGVPVEGRYMDVKYPGELSRTPRQYIVNSIKALNKLRGRARVLAERIADAEIAIAKKERAVIKIHYQIEQLVGGWVDGQGFRITPDANGNVPASARRIPGLIDKLTEKRDALRAEYEQMLAKQAESTVIDNVVVSKDQLEAAMIDTQNAIDQVTQVVDVLDQQINGINDSISQIENDQADIANSMEDIGVDPQEIIDAANKDGEALVGAATDVPDVPVDVKDAQVAQADLQDATLAAEQARAERTAARTAEIDARSQVQAAEQAYRDANQKLQEAQRQQTAGPQAVAESDVYSTEYKAPNVQPAKIQRRVGKDATVIGFTNLKLTNGAPQVGWSIAVFADATIAELKQAIADIRTSLSGTEANQSGYGGSVGERVAGKQHGRVMYQSNAHQQSAPSRAATKLALESLNEFEAALDAGKIDVTGEPITALAGPAMPARENVLAVLNDLADQGVIPSAVVKRIEKAYDAKYEPPKKGAAAKATDKIAFSKNDVGGAGGQRGLMVNVVNNELWATDSYAAWRVDPESAVGRKLAESGGESGVYRTEATGRARADIERAPLRNSGEAPNIEPLLTGEQGRAAVAAEPATIVGINLTSDGTVVIVESADGARVAFAQDNLHKVYETGDTIHIAEPNRPAVIKRDGNVVGIVMPLRADATVITPEILYQKIREGQFGNIGPAGNLLDQLPTKGRLAKPAPAVDLGALNEAVDKAAAELDAANTKWGSAQDAVKQADAAALTADNALQAAQQKAAALEPTLAGPRPPVKPIELTGKPTKPPVPQTEFTQTLFNKVKSSVAAIAKIEKTGVVGSATEARANLQKTVETVMQDVFQRGLQHHGAANVGVEWAAQTALTADEFAAQIALGPDLNAGYMDQLRFENEAIFQQLPDEIAKYVDAQLQYEKLKPQTNKGLQTPEALKAQQEVANAWRNVSNLIDEYLSNARLEGAINEQFGGATRYPTAEAKTAWANGQQRLRPITSANPFADVSAQQVATSALANDIKAAVQAKAEASVARTEELNGKDMGDPQRQQTGKARKNAAEKIRKDTLKKIKQSITGIAADIVSRADEMRVVARRDGEPNAVADMGKTFYEEQVTQLQSQIDAAQKQLETLIDEYANGQIDYRNDVDNLGRNPSGAMTYQKSAEITRTLGRIDSVSAEIVSLKQRMGWYQNALDTLTPVETIADTRLQPMPDTNPAALENASTADWTLGANGVQAIDTGYRQYELEKIEVGTTKAGKKKYAYELRRYGSDGQIIESATQRFASEAAAKKYVAETIAPDESVSNGRAVFRPGRELGPGSDLPMPRELIIAEQKLASAQGRLKSLEARAQTTADRIDNLRVQNAKRRSLLPMVSGAMTRLEARLGKEIITQPDVAVTEQGPTGRMFVGQTNRPPSILAPIAEGEVPRLGGSPVGAGLRPIAEYAPDQQGMDLVAKSIDEANLRRSEMLPPSLPLRVASEAPVEPGQAFLGSQYVPAGRPAQMTGGVASQTIPGLPGDILLRSERYRTGEFEEYYDIRELARVISREQRTMDLNEGFRLLLGSRMAVSPESMLPPEMIAQIKAKAYELTFRYDLGPDGQRIGMGAYAEGNVRRDYTASKLYRENYGRLLDEEMQKRGFKTLPTRGAIGGQVPIDRITETRPYLPAFAIEHVAQRVVPVTNQLPKLLESYLKGSQRLATIFKNVTLPTSATWQIGDIVGNFISAGVTGVDPGRLAEYMKAAIEANYGESAAGVTGWQRFRNIFKEDFQRPTNFVAEALNESGLQDQGLRISQQRRLQGFEQGAESQTIPQRILNKITPDIPRPTLEGGKLGFKEGNVGNAYPAFREKSYRINEAINKVMRHAYFLAKLDEALAQLGAERGIGKMTYEDVIAQNLHVTDPTFKTLWEDTIDTANEVLGDWMDLTAREKQYVLPNVTFYAWIKHVNKLFMKVARENPAALKWAVYLGRFAWDPSTDPFGLYSGLIRLPGGYLTNINFANPVNDVVGGGFGALLGGGDPRRLLGALGPGPRLLSAGLGINLSKLAPISRPYGTGNVSVTGREMVTPLALPNRWGDYLGYAVQQFPLVSKTLDILPAGQIPFTNIQTGPYERYDVGAARLRAGSRQPIEKVGGRAVAAGRLLSLPLLPTSTVKRTEEIKASAIKNLRAWETAKKKAELRYGG